MIYMTLPIEKQRQTTMLTSRAFSRDNSFIYKGKLLSSIDSTLYFRAMTVRLGIIGLAPEVSF